MYKDSILLQPLEELPYGTETYVPDNIESAEFDTESEAKEFMKDKYLIYEEFIDV